MKIVSPLPRLITNHKSSLDYHVENDKNGDFIPLVPRKTCLKFAEDIASGFLSELSELLEGKVRETEALRARVLDELEK